MGQTTTERNPLGSDLYRARCGISGKCRYQFSLVKTVASLGVPSFISQIASTAVMAVMNNTLVSCGEAFLLSAFPVAGNRKKIFAEAK